MATISQKYSPAVNTSPYYGRQLRNFAIKALITLFVFLILFVYLLPMGNMLLVSTYSQAMLSKTPTSSIWPTEPVKFEHNGELLPILKVPMEDGTVRELAMVKSTRRSATFIDPANPTTEIAWTGNWRTLEPVETFAPRFENFRDAWELANFPRLLRNTFFIAFVGMIGTLLSCIAVGYAFARFPIPGKNTLFLVLIGTIILPSQVTLIPTYAFWSQVSAWSESMGLGKWGTGSLVPLILPHFFANAYNVFLLRQYFLTLPRELDEAAMIDGAGPFGILLRVIIPQSWPAILSVAVFHFVWAWNDFFGPLIYLLGNRELQPISVGIQIFNFQFGPRPELVQATSLMAMLLPVLIFFLAQRVFMRGVVITGVEK
jgi:multiple sugar transport system permease protein